MKGFNPTDEEILSYLLQEQNEEFAQKVKKKMEQNKEFKVRVYKLAKIKNTVKDLSFEDVIYNRGKKSFFPFLKRLVFCLGVFIFGLVTESNLKIIQASKEAVALERQVTSTLSEPLSWEHHSRESLL